MTMISVFLVGVTTGFCIGLIIGCGFSCVGCTPPFFGKAPAPRQQKKHRTHEGTIFSNRKVYGGIH